MGILSLGFRQAIERRQAPREPERPWNPEDLDGANYPSDSAAGYESYDPSARRWGCAVVIAITLLALGLVVYFFFARVESRSAPAASAMRMLSIAFVIVAVVAVTIALAWLARWLRARENPLYWETACWILMTIGILLRPAIVSADDQPHADARSALIAVVASLLVLPISMRALNRITKSQGLAHVAVPVALGFFLNVSSLLAMTYIPDLPWIKND